jgi:hypothetical protein
MIYALDDEIAFFTNTGDIPSHVSVAMMKHIDAARSTFHEKIQQVQTDNKGDVLLGPQIASSDIRHGMWLINYYEERGQPEYVAGLKASMVDLALLLKKDEEALDVQ